MSPLFIDNSWEIASFSLKRHMISDLTFEIVQNAIFIFMIGMTSYQYDYIICDLIDCN